MLLGFYCRVDSQAAKRVLAALLLVCLTWLVACGERKSGHASNATAEVSLPSELMHEPTPERVNQLIEIGKIAFTAKGCIACHMATGEPLTGPGLGGIYGQTIVLADGSTVGRDLAYLYRSIVVPDEYKTVTGSLIMPHYRYLDEETLVGLVYFVKSLSGPSVAPGAKAEEVADE